MSAPTASPWPTPRWRAGATAAPPSGSAGAWTLTATGIATDGTSRTVTVTVNVESVFGLAAFGQLLGGATGQQQRRLLPVRARSASTRSFTELAGGSNVCGDRMCTPTGHGVVATNAELYLLGDGHRRRRPGRGPQRPGGGPRPVAGRHRVLRRRPPDLLQPQARVLPASPSSSIPTRWYRPPTSPTRGRSPAATLPAGRQLYTNMTLDSNTVVQGTPEHPSIVYLTGTLTVPNHAVVNFRPGGLVPEAQSRDC